MRVLGLIPARSGSKGIPGKNIRELAGRPLLAYTAEAAAAADRLAMTVLSTDGEDIAAVGRSLGLDVPGLRPPELARDDTPTLPVIQHVLETLEARGETFDAVCLLQATSPFRSAGLIDRCIDELERTGADAVVTIKAIPPELHPHWAYLRADDGTISLASGSTEPPPRRQELPAAFCREGSVYVTRVDVIRAGSLYGRTTVGIEVDAATTVNLDTEDDWREAEAMVAAGGPTARPTVLDPSGAG